MASLVVEADTWTNTMTVPDDGDTRSAASVTAAGTGFQVAADRTRYLYNRNFAAAGGSMLLPLQSMNQNPNAPVEFHWSAGAPLGTWRQVSTGGAGAMYLQIPHIPNATLTGLTARVHGDPNGAGPHAGAIGTMPQLSLATMNLTTGTWAVPFTQIDTTVAPATYEVMHDIALTFAAQSFTATTAFYAYFEGETGANAANDLLHLYAITATIVAA